MWPGKRKFTRRAVLRIAATSTTSVWTMDPPLWVDEVLAKPGEVDTNPAKEAITPSVGYPSSSGDAAGRLNSHRLVAGIDPQRISIRRDSQFLTPTEQRAVGEAKAAAYKSISDTIAPSVLYKEDFISDWSALIDYQGFFADRLYDSLTYINGNSTVPVEDRLIKYIGASSRYLSYSATIFSAADLIAKVFDRGVAFRQDGYSWDATIIGALTFGLNDFARSHYDTYYTALGILNDASHSFSESIKAERSLIGYSTPKF
jgi:hypothetical protein